MTLEAQRAVLVSDTPLGDVVTDSLKKGQSVVASCFVRRATTNAGVVGSAVKVHAGTVSGYVAVTTFPNKRVNRKMVFDIEESVLRKRLPLCVADS